MDYPEDWSPAERNVVDATIERICAELWARLHEYDSLRAGRNWDDIQKWLKDKRPTGNSIGARIADDYEVDIKRLQDLVAYSVEWGFIEGCAFVEGGV